MCALERITVSEGPIGPRTRNPGTQALLLTRLSFRLTTASDHNRVSNNNNKQNHNT